MTVIYFSNFSNPFIRMTSVTVCGSQFHSITMKKNTFHSLKVYLLFFFYLHSFPHCLHLWFGMSLSDHLYEAD